MIVCEACGTENPPDRKYCTKCARKLDPETQRAVALQRSEHTAMSINWSAIITALTALVVLLIVLAVLFLLVTHVL